MTGYECDVLMEWWFMNNVLLPFLSIVGILFIIMVFWYIHWKYGLYKFFCKIIPRRMKWWLQRRIRGYSNWDVYRLELFWTEIILKTLKSFKKMKRHGVLGDYWPDGTKEEIAVQNWKHRIDELIRGFQEYYDSQVGNIPDSWQREEEICQRFQKETLPKLQKDWFKFWD